jgi:hypothetical protein
MSKTKFDTFVFVINFIDDHWVSHHVIVSMFEALDTSRVALVEQMKSLLATYQFKNKVITYVKDKGINLNMLASALTSVVSCELL